MTFGLRHTFPDWFDNIACADMPIRFFYPKTSAMQEYAAKYCRLHCPVVDQCLAWALEHETETTAHGVWGGKTEAQRRRMLRRRAA